MAFPVDAGGGDEEEACDADAEEMVAGEEGGRSESNGEGC